MEPQHRRTATEEDAVFPELVDKIEYQAAELEQARTELETIRSEREKLETDLVIAERWVATLARELELADLQLKEARPLTSRLRALETPKDD
jgi:chromosome segregation ATPase